MGGFCLSDQVRKGAWTQQEDVLLSNCVQANGEGNWHLVPAKAGLNRCRKSCRLRWLNYLKPNLKRGVFEEDEVDLILKLHKLLGNRWAMIAKRLPGRTGNDVKNYWNTHLAKKFSRPQQALTKSSSSSSSSSSWRKNNKLAPSNNVVRVQAIRPKPRIFKNGLWHVRSPTSLSHPPPPPPASEKNHEMMNWWETLLLADNNEEEVAGHQVAALNSQGNTITITSNAKLAGNTTKFEDTDSLIMTTSSSSQDHFNTLSIWEKLLATHHDDDTELLWEHLIS